jgi:hypothetical protein
MPCVNLIPEPRRRAARKKRTIRHWTAGCVVYALAMVGAYLFASASFGAGSLPVESELVRTGRTIDQSSARIDHLRSRLENLRMKLSANESVGNQPDWGLMLEVLAEKMGPFVVLRRCDLEPMGELDKDGREMKVDVTSLAPQRASGLEGGYRLILEGVGRDQTAVWEFILGIEKLELFDEVRLVQSQGEVFNAQRAVGFHLICRLGREVSR